MGWDGIRLDLICSIIIFFQGGAHETGGVGVVGFTT